MTAERARTDFHAIFPRLSKAVGNERIARWLGEFAVTFWGAAAEDFARGVWSPREWERLECFRSFPLFLRAQGRQDSLIPPFWTDLALVEWAEFAALFSPVDERSDQRSLALGERMLNPSVQILRLEHDVLAWTGGVESPPLLRQMIFIYRAWDPSHGFQIRRRIGDAVVATILDPLLEAGRMTDPQLRAELGEDREPVWGTMLKSLVADQLVLEGVSEP